MTVRQNTKLWKQIQRMAPATAEDIREVIFQCEGESDLQVVGNMIRVLANTGLRNGEFMTLRISDIDPGGQWLQVSRRRGMGSEMRMLPLRSRTLAALNSLHDMNPESELVLGDSPRTRFDYTIRKLKIIAPQFGRARLWTYPIRLNFEYRLMSAGIPTGMVKYCLGRHMRVDPFDGLSLTHDQILLAIRRSIERFLDEL